ncbi:MAG: rhodanese-like domain-containing protein [Bacteroidales bacterium]|nr:rhodanese-like domain-containing protein [Bacteroidales bacterium]
MKKLDLILIAILFIGASWAAFTPNKQSKANEISPEELTYKMSLDRYFTTEEVALFIMNEDPSILLVDIRDQKDFSEFSIPGALNIPYDSILSPNYISILNPYGYRTILFSNGSSFADQAWLVCTRAGYENLYVMEGGLNTWIETVINPVEPKPYASPEEFDLYRIRKGASLYFGTAIPVEEGDVEAPNIIIQQNTNNTEESGGGCG